MTMSELSQQHDRFSAQDVIIKYAACIDDRDFEKYRECFASDVELHGFGAEVIRGVDVWIDFVHKALSNFFATQHMLGPPQVELNADRAEMRTDLQAQHFLHEPKGRIFTLWGTYRTSLVRTDPAWKIVRHELVTRATRSSDAYRV
jgi:hypothetical protein